MIQALERPFESTERRTMHTSSSSKSFCPRYNLASLARDTSNSAKISVFDAPDLTTEGSPRPPIIKFIAPKMIDLPAPVSPVIAVKPDSRSKSSSSISTKSLIDRRNNISDQKKIKVGSPSVISLEVSENDRAPEDESDEAGSQRD